MGVTAHAVRERGDQHHADRFHGKARTLGDEYVAALRAPQQLIGLPIDLAKDRLCAVEQHVSDAAQPLLQRLQDLRLLVGDAAAVVIQPPSRQPGDDAVARAEDQRGCKRHQRIDGDQSQRNGHQQHGGADQRHERQQHAQYRAAYLVR